MTTGDLAAIARVYLDHLDHLRRLERGETDLVGAARHSAIRKARRDVDLLERDLRRLSGWTESRT